MERKLNTMNYIGDDQSKILKTLRSLDIKNLFNLSFLASSEGMGVFELTEVKNEKQLNFTGHFPILFFNSKRHVLLTTQLDALRFFRFEKISLSNVKLSKIFIDFEKSILEIQTEQFGINLFCNERAGWAINYKDSDFLMEAIEYGGVELWKK
jgi:hypothetical protein